MSNRPIVLVTIACGVLLSSGLASAQELRWHLGASIAQDYDKRATSDYTAHAENAGGLLGGVQFENGFGVELAYIDLGHLLSPGVLSGGFESEGHLWSLGTTYGARFDNIEPYARLGWFSRKETGRTIGIPGSQAFRGSDEGVVAELGLRWFLTDPLGVRLGWVWYDFETRHQGRAQLAVEWHF